MPSDEPLKDARFKIERAKSHIEDLKRTIVDFSQSRPYELIRYPQLPGTEALILRLNQPIPDDIFHIVGDIISNLRASLDHIASGLAVANGQASKKVYFPTADSDSELMKPYTQDKIKKLSPAAITFINDLEPYEGGKNEQFWLLGKLENVNKHNRLVAVGHTARNILSQIDIISGNVDIVVPEWDVENDCMIIGTISSGGEVESNIQLTFDIAFNEAGLIENQLVVPFFEKLADAIEDVRKECARQFF